MSEQPKPVGYMHKWPNGKTAFTTHEKPPSGFDGWNAVTTPLYAELDMIPTEESMRAYHLLNQAVEAMEALHSKIEPDEECEDGIVPAAALRAFVDAHAELLYRRKSLAPKAWGHAIPWPATGRWYAIDREGMATLCSGEADAIKNAKDAAEQFPRRAPYVAAQLLALPAGWTIVPIESPK